ncbi:unnamed protein product [Effrenium voratum]|uniref:Uncharacterized protein n=1 Tax=Effrenium voratum TaxID=2562239 RepID=A0AA36MRZ9_9DINO|nr:unnamed protein product [Effrenium voratum]
MTVLRAFFPVCCKGRPRVGRRGLWAESLPGVSDVEPKQIRAAQALPHATCFSGQDVAGLASVAGVASVASQCHWESMILLLMQAQELSFTCDVCSSRPDDRLNVQMKQVRRDKT